MNLSTTPDVRISLAPRRVQISLFAMKTVQRGFITGLTTVFCWVTGCERPQTSFQVASDGPPPGIQSVSGSQPARLSVIGSDKATARLRLRASLETSEENDGEFEVLGRNEPKLVKVAKRR
jgi:hypothetical protein